VGGICAPDLYQVFQSGGEAIPSPGGPVGDPRGPGSEIVFIDGALGSFPVLFVVLFSGLCFFVGFGDTSNNLLDLI
jgi:hypothetical protein